MNTTRGTMQLRFFLAFALITVLAVAIPAVFSRSILYQDRVDLAARQALAQASILKSLFEADPQGKWVAPLLASLPDADLRLTVTDASGTVIHDSHFGGNELADLDNHGDRPEIEAAESSGSGVSIRHSNSLGVDAVYAAVKLNSGGTLRLAVPLADIRRSLEQELAPLGLVMAGVGCLCLLLSLFITRHFRNGIDCMAEIVADIAKKRGNRRLLQVPGREFLPLAYAVNRMAENIEDYVATTTDQQTQLEAILDSMHEGVLVLGPSGGIRRCNRAMQALFPSVCEAAGRQLIEAIPVPALQRAVEALLQGKSGESAPGMADEQSEAIHFETDTGRFLVAHLSRPELQNQSLGAVVMVYDATDIMRLERVRRDFVANVSHELRTPLTSISGYAETLMHLEDMPQEYRNFASIINKHAKMLARVISNLLALARIEDTRETIPLAPTDPAEPLNEALRLCAEQAEQKELCISLCLAPSSRVSANASLLTQVFRNLLENACRYSPQNGQICIASTVEGKEMHFSIKDRGPGIPKKELSRIFERLYQIKRQRNSGSSGIGLAISRHIIERHGGRIWAESPSNDFATAMHFTLPLA